MEYTFSWGWFMAGMAVIICGAALALWYRPIADTLGGGAGSYERYKLWGLVTCGVGVLVMLNFHSLVLSFIFRHLFGSL